MALTKISTGMLKQDAASSDLNIDAGTLYLDVSNNRVGVANTSPAYTLDISGSSTIARFNSSNTNAYLRLDTTSATSALIGSENGRLIFSPNSTTGESLSIASNGRVGIGVTSVSSSLHVYHATDNNLARFQSGDATAHIQFRDSNTTYIPSLGAVGDDLTFSVGNGGPERMRIDSSGNVGIGTNSPSIQVDVENTVANSGGKLRLGTSDSSTSGVMGRLIFGNGNDIAQSIIEGLSDGATDASALIFKTEATGSSETERMRIDSSGNVGIGTSSPTSYADTTLHISGSTGSTIKLSSDAQGNADTDGFDISHAGLTAFLNNRENGEMQFRTNNTERMRIDSSGNLLVGKTDTTFNTAGIALRSADVLQVTRSGDTALELNRTSNDGKLAGFFRSGVLFGSIGAINSNNLFIGSTSSNHSGIQFGTAVITPMLAGSENDGSVDIGFSNARFKDLYLSSNAYANTYRHDGDSDTYFNFPAANQLSLVGGGAEIVRAYQIAGAYGILKVYGSGSATYPNFTFNGDDNTGMYQAAADNLAFATGGSERMRIDSSGNVLIGTTTESTWTNTAGHIIRPNSSYTATRDGAQPLIVNRLTSDGTIIDIRNDGATDGQINTYSGRIAIGSGSTGIMFDSIRDVIAPHTMSGNDYSTTIDLGRSVIPFQNLHLSGTAYAASLNIDGGTIKLDGNYPTGTGNIALGDSSLNGSITGGYNVAIGPNALDSLTSGFANIGIGNQAGTALENGYENVAIGRFALAASSAATLRTVAIGTSAANAGSSYSIGIGHDSLKVATGNNHVAIGFEALKANTTAANNTAVGYKALTANTTGAKNVALGYQALDANTTGNNNIAIGYDALTTATASNNIAVGKDALRLTTTGTANVAVGHEALENNTTSDNNTAVGYEALTANTTGANNVALGTNSLDANTTGSANVALGASALSANTTAGQNVAVGHQALLSNTTGQENVAVGYQAAYTNSTGVNNVALGRRALYLNVASNNTALGHQTLYNNTTGYSNVALGGQALQSNTTGQTNTAVGYQTLLENTTASHNTGLGWQALRYNTTGDLNVAVGYAALKANVTGDRAVAVGVSALAVQAPTSGDTYNVAVGYNAGGGITTGIDNTLIGGLAGDSLTDADYNVAIGRSALSADTKGSRSIAVGWGALGTQNFTTATNTYNIAIGHSAAYTLTTGAHNTIIGGDAGDALTTGSNNTALGFNSLTANTTGASNVTVGKEAGFSNTTASFSTLIGYGAGRLQNTTGQNTHVGYQAGYYNTDAVNMTSIGYRAAHQASGANSTAIGTQALYSASTGNSNTAVGVNSLYANTSGEHNTGVGSNVLRFNTTGYYNTAVGYQTAYSNSTGTSNTALGRQALYQNTTASNNTAIGHVALHANTTGGRNTAVGREALYANGTGQINTALGDRALRNNGTGQYNTVAGVDAGYANTTGNYNSAYGVDAMGANTSGSFNTAMGYLALRNNTTANTNTAIGYQSLYTNSAGTQNVAIGSAALYSNTNNYNTAVGHNSQRFTTTGNLNTSIGIQSLYGNTTGIRNVAVGYLALNSNTTTSDLVAIGTYALQNQTTGQYATAVGRSALSSNTSAARVTAVGYAALGANTTGADNTAVGAFALDTNTTGYYNSALGRNALTANTTGVRNTAIGMSALLSNQTGNDNTVLGFQAGYSSTGGGSVIIGSYAGQSTTGALNTFIGTDAGYYVSSGQKNTILGRYNGNQGGLDIRTSSNNIVLSDGDGNARWYYNNGAWLTNSNLGGAQGPGVVTDHNSAELGSGYLNLQRDDTVAIKQILFGKNGNEVGSISTGASSTAYNTSSDHRLKENVVNLTGATARLKQLEPKRFNFIADADTTVDGFLAHEVQSVVPEAITGTHNEVDNDGNPVYQGIDQSKLVPLLVATIKELEARITALESQ